jgi:hypothetical protein
MEEFVANQNWTQGNNNESGRLFARV